MTNSMLLSPPDITDLEESYVIRALRSSWPAPGGPEVERFERELAAFVGVAEVVAVSSGTAALHLSLLAAGIGPGDVVAVPALTFAATVNAVHYVGAQPLIVDVAPGDGTIDVDLLGDVLDANRGVTAVIPVDLFGHCADYPRLLPLARRHGVAVVCDAAEALGASLAGRAAGAVGRAGIFSFNGNKILTTSGGGAVATDDRDLAAQCRRLANQARLPVAHFEHDAVGYNYRLSAVLAALGRAQLQRLPGMMKRRRTIRERYLDAFADRPEIAVLGGDDPGGNCWLTAITVDPAAGWRAGQLADALAAAGVETRPMWRPMHRQPAYTDAPTALTGAADRIDASGLVLPNGSAATDDAVEHLFAELRRFLASPRPDRAARSRSRKEG
ncbi:DegT/DnrJ/EryC1/StrS family aminotransferase [Pilimelia columellifera]|uniref:Aminotransferase class I/II-fold pyridoxal phosphate-dependent enzyme n=1 Tax=Pilimelia columellifera subsp. columellifera TaxID=706583 RepID=A0ABN3MZ37_9ACTN